MSKLIEAIREYLGLGLSRADAVALAQAETASQPAIQNGPTVPAMTPAGAEAVAARRKRRYKGRKFYMLTPAAKLAAVGTGPLVAATADLVPSHAATLQAIASAKRLVTAREIESLAAQKRKTVESSIWNLRHMGFITSILRDDTAAVETAKQSFQTPAPAAKARKSGKRSKR